METEAEAKTATEIEVEISTDGPPPGISRRGRWAEAHFTVQKANPGEWVVFKGLSRKDGSSLRTSLASKVEDIVARHQDDGSVHVWVLREEGPHREKEPQGSQSRHAQVAPAPVTASVATNPV